MCVALFQVVGKPLSWQSSRGGRGCGRLSLKRVGSDWSGGGDATCTEILEPEVNDWLGLQSSPPASGKWLAFHSPGVRAAEQHTAQLVASCGESEAEPVTAEQADDRVEELASGPGS